MVTKLMRHCLLLWVHHCHTDNIDEGCHFFQLFHLAVQVSLRVYTCHTTFRWCSSRAGAGVVVANGLWYVCWSMSYEHCGFGNNLNLNFIWAFNLLCPLLSRNMVACSFLSRRWVIHCSSTHLHCLDHRVVSPHSWSKSLKWLVIVCYKVWKCVRLLVYWDPTWLVASFIHISKRMYQLISPPLFQGKLVLPEKCWLSWDPEN